jgi:arylsulfatase A-like enzyme
MIQKRAVLIAAILGGTALLAVAVLRSSERGRTWRANKVVLITIDTLRRGRLGCYGYHKKPTSPHLDAWAKEAVVFDRAVAQAPWTIPSLGSLFTGRYPVEVGTYTNSGAIRPEFVTLPQLFRQHGFVTASFNTHALLVNERDGFRRGFDEVFPPHVKPAKPNQHKIPFGETEPYLLPWLQQHAHERFFIWIHDMDPHAPPTVDNPYLTQPGWKGYDGEVRWVDESIARIRESLEELSIWDQSLLIFTADHGEAFGEHKLAGHQDVMYDEVLQVPLIIQYAGMPGPKRVGALVELLDLFPTIAELAGLPVPPGTYGESLVPLIEGRRERREKQELISTRYHFGDRHHEFAIRDPEWKLLAKTPDQDPNPPEDRFAREQQRPRWGLDAPGTRFELYQLRLDPGETVNRFAEEPAVALRLERALSAWRSTVLSSQGPAHPLPTVDAATEEALRALGYAK